MSIGFDTVRLQFSNGKHLDVEADHPLYSTDVLRTHREKSQGDNVPQTLLLPPEITQDLVARFIKYLNSPGLIKNAPATPKNLTLAHRLYKCASFFKDSRQYNKVDQVKAQIAAFITNNHTFQEIETLFGRYRYDAILKPLYQSVYPIKLASCDLQQVNSLVKTAAGPLFKRWGMAARFLLALKYNSQRDLNDCIKSGLSNKLMQSAEELLKMLDADEQRAILDNLPQAFTNYVQTNAPQKVRTWHFSHLLPQRWPTLQRIGTFIEDHLLFYPFNFFPESVKTINAARHFEKLNARLQEVASWGNRNDIQATLRNDLNNTTYTVNGSWNKQRPNPMNSNDHKIHGAKVIIQTALRVAASALINFAVIGLFGSVSELLIPVGVLIAIFMSAFMLATNSLDLGLLWFYQALTIFMVIATVGAFAESIIAGIGLAILTSGLWALTSAFEMLFQDKCYKAGQNGVFTTTHNRQIAYIIAYISEALAPYLLKVV